MSALRLLALDHYFRHDIDALRRVSGVEIRSVPFTRLRDQAVRVLGAEVAIGLEPFMDPARSAARERYAMWLRDEIETMFVEWPFDAMILPSDTFFYVRDLPPATHRLGAPTIVVQKETTISPATMRDHSRIVGRHAPFASDMMTVCSDRHRDFWVRTGADATRIVVTGQPRFDMYATAAPPRQSGVPRVLFLSYELDAYVPGVGRGTGQQTWRQLRDETEHVLAETAKSGQAAVVVKHHPQQRLTDERARWRQLAAESWGRGLTVAHPDADVRELIVEADVVVAFQTTGIYEAVAAGRPTIQAAWTDAYQQHRHELIRFDDAPACVAHADSPEALRRLISQAPAPGKSCRSWYEEELGPVDGHAAERTVAVIRDCCTEWEWTDLARRLSRPEHRRKSARRRLAPEAAREVALRLGLPVSRIIGRSRGLDLRLADHADRRRRLLDALRDSA